MALYDVKVHITDVGNNQGKQKTAGFFKCGETNLGRGNDFIF